MLLSFEELGLETVRRHLDEIGVELRQIAASQRDICRHLNRMAPVSRDTLSLPPSPKEEDPALSSQRRSRFQTLEF